MSTDDLAPLFNPEAGSTVRYGAGKVIAWNADGFANTIEFNGTPIEDFSVYGGINALTVQSDDDVALLGYESPGGISTWFVLGRIIPPGEDASDLVMRGGKLTIAGGQLRTLYPSGNLGAFFGPLVDAGTGEGTGHGLLVQADVDGSDILRAVERPDGTREVLIGGSGGSVDRFDLWAQGHNLIANDTASGAGLARPYLSYPLAPTTDAQIVGTTLVPTTESASYVPIYEGEPSVWHPRVSYSIGISATGVTDWRIRANGTTVFTGSPGASGVFDIPGWGSTVTPGNHVTFTIEARNTGGGLTRVRVLRFEGRQS